MKGDEMGRRVVLAVLAAATAAVGVTPAYAEDAPPWPLSCVVDAPDGSPMTSVYFDATGLHLNIGAVPDDVSTQAAWAESFSGYVLPCLSEKVPTGPVDCVAGVVANLDSYVVINGTQISVLYPALIRDLTACAGA
jgi:hypothetical protein